MENRKRNASFAGRGDVVDTNFIIRELEIRVRDRDSVQFTQKKVSMIDHGFKP